MRRNREKAKEWMRWKIWTNKKYRIFSRVQPCLVISLLINHVTNAGIQTDSLQFLSSSTCSQIWCMFFNCGIINRWGMHLNDMVSKIPWNLNYWKKYCFEKKKLKATYSFISKVEAWNEELVNVFILKE